MINRLKASIVAGGVALSVGLAGAPRAEACGCFTPPDPSVPVVQAGERIAFAMKDGEVTAHIQIQYSGDAKEFGWILPLPSVPTLELGVDELFTQLTALTQPKYRLKRVYEGNCSFDPTGKQSGGPVAAGASGGTTNSPTDAAHDPLVVQDSIGPYDYAVLKADSKADMLKWLSDNRYFVPGGTDDAVSAYIHPGAFFLALKLRSGNSTGDLQPVVVHYKSDLPMIPIVLTSVGAEANMGIQVWMLGNGRAIPRNYYHTVVNDALIDWFNAGQNYNDVIIKAVGEAPGKHSFVTEYAGPSTPLQKILNAPGRFGSQAELAAEPDALGFVQYLQSHGYGVAGAQPGRGGGPVRINSNAFPSQLTSILAKYIPEPAPVAASVPPAQFYQQLDYYLGSYRQQHPDQFAGWALNYQPAMMAQEITDRLVTPTVAAGAMFDAYPYLTRLYTTLSPEDMNKDPVFSFNAKLPPYPNVHEATLTYHCGYFGGGNAQSTPATLATAAGFNISYPSGVGPSVAPPVGLPGSDRIEVLSEEGAPQVVTDNTRAINRALGSSSSGCSVAVGGRSQETAAGLFGMVLVAGALLLRRRRAE